MESTPSPINSSSNLSGKITSKIEAWRMAVAKGFRSSESRYVAALAILVGAAAGIAAYIFHFLIEFMSQYGVKDISSLSLLPWSDRAMLALRPALGGLAVGALTWWITKPEREQGVPHVIHALIKKSGFMRTVPTLLKSLAATITIGSGGSAGPEGPIAETGAATGSFLGRLVKVPPEIMRMLVAGGAAGGIAASFHAPIGGVFFALEILLAEFTPQAFSIVVLSSVTATIVSRSLLGAHAYFSAPLYNLGNHWEIVLFAFLGIACGVLSKVYVQILDGMDDLFTAQKKMPRWMRPAVGGLIVGAMSMLLPQVLGSGHKIIENALWGSIPFQILAALFLAKMIATAITLGSGGVGGVFLPGFFVGATFGGAFGVLVNILFHKFGIYSVSASGAYALVGMAALLSGSTRAPMTIFLILFEITDNYEMIIPVMTASVLSYFVARSIEGHTIYTRKLAERGIKEQTPQSVKPLEFITVGEVMTTKTESISPSMPLDKLAHLVETKGHSGFPVVDERNKLVGLVTFDELRTALGTEDLPHSAVVSGDLMRTPPPLVFRDQSLSEALRRLGELKVDRLVVVPQENPTELVGIITKHDILSVYHKLLMEGT